MKFDYQTCIRVAADLKTSASNVSQLIEELEEEMNSISANYVSDSAREIMEKLTKVKNNGPEFVDAVNECSKYLSDTVAPSYLKLEQTASEKVN